MRRLGLPAVAIFISLGFNPMLLAHGTGARILTGPAAIVEFYYTDGEPMAYAEAKVFSPAVADVPFVNGRADKLGRVAFAADRDGVWRVLVQDNEGHKVTSDVTVANGLATPTRALIDKPWLLWASLFANAFAFATWFDAWRASRKPSVSPNASPGAT